MLFRNPSCVSHRALPSVALWRTGGTLLPSANRLTSGPRWNSTLTTPQEASSGTSPKDAMKEGIKRKDEQMGPPTGDEGEGTRRSAAPCFSPLHPLLQEQDALTPPIHHRSLTPHAASFSPDVSPISPSPMTEETAFATSSFPTKVERATDHPPHPISSFPFLASLPLVDTPSLPSRSAWVAFHMEEALRKQLCHPVRPLPVKGVYLQLCHSYRVMAELYHSSTSCRLSKLRGALRFLRRHNVLLHSLLFYVPRGPDDALVMRAASSLERSRRSPSSSSTRNTASTSSSSSSSSSFFSSDVSSWNVTSEFTRLRLFGEAFLHAELRTRLWKLLPDLPTEVFVDVLQRCTSAESYATLFDQLALGTLVGARPPKPLSRKTKRRLPRRTCSTAGEEDLSPTDTKKEEAAAAQEVGKKETCSSFRCRTHDAASTKTKTNPRRKPKHIPEGLPLREMEGRPSADERAQLQRERALYRHAYSFTPHEKGSMLCALVGELRWFGCRTRATHRTHNNAIFPPSDVLILHVLATHVVECVPAEMLFSLVQPSLLEVKQKWVNFSTSLPSQLAKRFTPSRCRYRLSSTSSARPTTTSMEKAAGWGKEEEKEVPEAASCHTPAPPGPLSTFPVSSFSALPLCPTSTAIESVIRPTIRIRGIKGGVGSAHYRLFIRDVKEWSKDTQFSRTRGSSSLSSSSSVLSSVGEAPEGPTHASVENDTIKAESGMSSERRRELLAGLSV